MIIRNEAVVDRWTVLLENCTDEARGLLADVESYLGRVGHPDLHWQETSGEPGVLGGLRGKRRDVLTVRFAPLPEYVVCIGAHPFGAHCLHVSWTLVAEPKAKSELRRAFRLTHKPEVRHELGSELTYFELLTIDAFLATTKKAVHFALARLRDEEEPPPHELAAYDFPGSEL